MLGQSGYSRAMLPNVRDIERRLRSLSSIADRFRGGAHSMGDEAAKLGNDVLRRLSNEIEHRPLVTLAVAVGVGILVGLAIRSAAGASRTAR
jgi:ElaB/YqjD/DUF883 family membrane-anchored ribosome-binding protein